MSQFRSPASVSIHRLDADHADGMDGMLDLFAEAFDEPETYAAARPDRRYLQTLLANAYFIALVARKGERVVGALAAYELPKFEQERCEYYIYDLAVAAGDRRQGIATALINELRVIAAARGAHTIFIQADSGDEPAIALYSKLGVREEVLHFDIAVEP